MRLTPFLSDKSKPEDLYSLYATTRTIHLVFLASMIIYVIVGLLIKSFIMEEGSGFLDLPRSEYSVLFTVLSVAGVVLGYLVLVALPRRTTGQDSLAGSGVSSLVELGRELSQRHLIRVALCDAIAILGLVLFLLNGSLLPLLLFAGIALALLLAIYPRRENWDEIRWQAEMKGTIKTVE